MKFLIVVIVLIILVIWVIFGSSSAYHSKILLNRRVMVSIKCDTTLGSENYIIIQVYKPGNYLIKYGDPSDLATVAIVCGAQDIPQIYSIHERIDEDIKILRKWPITIHYPMKVVVAELNDQISDSVTWK